MQLLLFLSVSVASSAGIAAAAVAVVPAPLAAAAAAYAAAAGTLSPRQPCLSGFSLRCAALRGRALWRGPLKSRSRL